LIEILDIRVA